MWKKYAQYVISLSAKLNGTPNCTTNAFEHCRRSSLGALSAANPNPCHPEKGNGPPKTFKCADTEALSQGRRVKRFVNVESVARRKLRQLQIAGRLGDLRVPPGDRLEALKGDRAGQHSLRGNDQLRVCFRWTAAGAEDVEIADYH